MDIQLINKELLKELHDKAVESERLRMNLDLRTTPENASQRMLALPTSVDSTKHASTMVLAAPSVECAGGWDSSADK